MRIAVGIAAALVFAAGLYWATLQEAGVTCEVCIVFEGREACRDAVGADRDAAIRGAQSVACSMVSSGVTRGMQCDRVTPRSVQCTGD